MSARVVRYLLERITALDLNLMGRLGRRELGRLTSGLRQARHMHGPVSNSVATNRETDLTLSSLTGLEVEYSSGSTVSVRAGSMFFYNPASTTPSDVTEARLGTWSGRVETDDYFLSSFVLPAATSAAPSVSLSSPLASPEWWVVYVTPSEKVVETDSQRRVFNETTGAFDAASASKVKQHQLTPGVVRGTPGGGVPNVPGGYDVPIAWIYVPAGATNLSGATIFDVRKIHDEIGLPNEVGGSWRIPFAGTMPNAYSYPVWRGTVWARIGGERLFASSAYGLTMPQLAEPGATWDATASGSAPKFAWLYLCRPKGVVPRPRRQGSAVIGSSGRSDRTILDGVLVLSPTPPKIGVRATLAPDAALRWDLRPSTALALPNNDLGGSVPYAFGGITVQSEDAVAVGFMLYTAIDTLSHPRVEGSMTMTSDGWCSGNPISVLPSPDIGSFTPTVALSTLKIDFTQGAISVGGTSYLLPFVGWRAATILSNDSVPLAVQWQDENAGDTAWVADLGGGNKLATRVLTKTGVALGEAGSVDFASGSVAVGTPSSMTLAVSLHSVRFPYGVPLVT